MIANELLDAIQISFNGLLQLVAPWTIIGNFVQNLAYDQVLSPDDR